MSCPKLSGLTTQSSLLSLLSNGRELDNARRQVQSCTDKYGVSSRQYTDAITNMEALHASAAAKTASEIIDEIGLHTEQCKPAAD